MNSMSEEVRVTILVVLGNDVDVDLVMRVYYMTRSDDVVLDYLC